MGLVMKFHKMGDHEAELEKVNKARKKGLTFAEPFGILTTLSAR